jgi:hypothetical protein
MKLVVYGAKVTVTASDLTTSSKIYLSGDAVIVRKETDEIPNTVYRFRFADMTMQSQLEVIKVYGTGEVIVETPALSCYTLKLIAIANGNYDKASIAIRGPAVPIPRVVIEACNGIIWSHAIVAENHLQVRSTGRGLVNCAVTTGCLLQEDGPNVTVNRIRP